MRERSSLKSVLGWIPNGRRWAVIQKLGASIGKPVDALTRKGIRSPSEKRDHRTISVFAFFIDRHAVDMPINGA